MKKRKFTMRTLVVFFLIVYVAVMLVKQEMASFKISKEISKANAELQLVNNKNEQLQDELNMARTNLDKYREIQARERLGYIKQNETPVKPKSDNK